MRAPTLSSLSPPGRHPTSNEQEKKSKRQIASTWTRRFLLPHRYAAKRRLRRPKRRDVFVLFSHRLRTRLRAEHHPVDALGQLYLPSSAGRHRRSDFNCGRGGGGSGGGGGGSYAYIQYATNSFRTIGRFQEHNGTFCLAQLARLLGKSMPPFLLCVVSEERKHQGKRAERMLA